MYVFSKAVGEVVLERTGPEDGDISDHPEVFRARGAVINGAGNEGFLLEVVPMCDLVCFVFGSPLIFSDLSTATIILSTSAIHRP